MPDIVSRENNPLPGIAYSEIHIPDEDNIGTGVFTTVLEEKAMSRINPIMSAIRNTPVFQMIVSINVAENEITVLLGKADGSPATSREVFILPKDTDSSRSHRFDTVFREWKVTDLQLNGDSLKRVTA